MAWDSKAKKKCVASIVTKDAAKTALRYKEVSDKIM